MIIKLLNTVQKSIIIKSYIDFYNILKRSFKFHDLQAMKFQVK